MLIDLIRGKITIFAAIAIAAIIIGRFMWREHSKNQRQQEATMAHFAPALSKLTPESLNNSEWAYRGPLGELTLYFNPDGSLTITSASGTDTGSWSISGSMLSASIPGADTAHEGIFRDSTNELVGPIPSQWSATRIAQQDAAANP